MRKELSDLDVEQAIGGTVVITQDFMRIGFTTIGSTKRLRNCTYEEATGLVNQLYAANNDKSNEEFDTIVRDTFKEKGWIS